MSSARGLLGIRQATRLLSLASPAIRIHHRPHEAANGAHKEYSSTRIAPDGPERRSPAGMYEDQRARPTVRKGIHRQSAKRTARRAVRSAARCCPRSAESGLLYRPYPLRDGRHTARLAWRRRRAQRGSRRRPDGQRQREVVCAAGHGPVRIYDTAAASSTRSATRIAANLRDLGDG